ncbi:MAG TPA: amino acid adenylation domain-containing protein, partial [Thermoanaerobaculia bacterium]|nr:amino acid adenylation domain-containing protein [Thermoanaerobaculia bacterium]
VPREGKALPLSFAQQRLWFLEQLAPGRPTYNIATPVRVQGLVRADLLTRALSEVVRRHETLRTSYARIDGQPAQVIHPPRPVRVPVLDLTALEETVRGSEAGRTARAEARRPFDLGRPEPLRAALARLATGGERAESAVLLTTHHIASDGWSLGVLTREMVALMGAFAAGRPSPLPELAIQYADFAVWQRERLQGEALESQLAYWRGRLAGIPSGLELPADRPRPAVQSFDGERLALALPADLFALVRTASRRRGSTLFMTLLAAFQATLGRESGQDDLVVGAPIAGRNRIEIEPLIGFFVNTLPLRATFGDDPDVTTFTARVREAALGAFAHQDLPFEQLVDHLEVERDLSRHPVFQVAFVLQNVPLASLDDDGPVRLAAFPLDEGTAKFDLTLAVTEEGGVLSTEWEFSTALFDRSTIARFQGHFANLLGAFADSPPERRISRLPILSDGERCQLLGEWNHPGLQLQIPPSLPASFAAQVAATPRAVAVSLGAEELTYEQLDFAANRLANRLVSLGVGPEARVGLAVERSLAMIVGLVGILKAGGAYLPLDPAYPAERLAFMIEDAEVAAVVTTEDLVAALPACGAPVVVLDGGLERERPVAPKVAILPDHPAYVIYTSGSTGRPKGVVVSHGNALRLFAATDAWFGFGPEDVWSLFHSYAFDFSVWEIWGALLYGGRIAIVPQATAREPEAFYRLLCRERVTILNQTPSAFRQLIRAATEAPDLDSKVRAVVFGGEALDLPGLAPWFAARGDRHPVLVNMYGITETTVHVTYRPIAQADARPGIGSRIGVPIPDLQVHLADSRLELCPIGAPGEILVGGSGLARGYLGRPDLTAARFVPDPFGPTGKRLYRSGDLARRRPDGDVEYLGRVDSQVKIRGFRIELGEIEALLGAHPRVAAAVVVASPAAAGGEPRLTAYLVASGEAPAIEPLRRFLGERLPLYMLPAAFVTVSELPRTPSGKVDRRALAARGFDSGERAGLEQEYVAPEGDLEAGLASVWAEVLGIERVGVEDNFFALGGDSMLSLQIVAKAEERGIAFALQEIYLHQTVRALGRAIEAAAAAEGPAEDEEAELDRMLAELEGLSDEEVRARLES